MKQYICNDCGECQCTIENDDETDIEPTNCIYGGGVVTWVNQSLLERCSTSRMELELNKRGYVVIKKGDFR